MAAAPAPRPLPTRERPTVRALLFDPADRILLMKGRLPTARDEPGAWFTIGGKIEAGETTEAAARREILEETGFAQVWLGPVVWLRDAVLFLADGAPSLCRERYIVARARGGEPSREGWRPWEHDLCDDLRWWPLDELASCREAVFPQGLAELALPIAAGAFPDRPRLIV